MRKLIIRFLGWACLIGGILFFVLAVVAVIYFIYAALTLPD